MKISFKKINLTPNHSVRMGGYERTEKSKGVFDHIEANILLIESNNELFANLVLDSICVSDDFCEYLKEKCSDILSTDKSHIIISCIHTHSAPCFFKLAFEDTLPEEELVEQAKEQFISGVYEIKDKLQEVTMKLSSCKIDNIYGNRNVKDGLSDKSFNVLEFFNSDDKLIYLYANISVHPTLLNGKNLYLSADILGNIRMSLQNNFNCPVMITNGTCGDVSTRFYRKSTDTVASIGNEITEQYLSKKSYINNINFKLKGFKSISMTKDVDFSKDKINQNLIAKLSKDSMNPLNKMLIKRCNIKNSLGAFKMTLKATIVDCNDIIFVFLPGDICSYFGKQIKDAFKNKFVIINGYSNTYCNYLVPESDYGKYFETFNSRLLKGQADNFINEVIKQGLLLINKD